MASRTGELEITSGSTIYRFPYARDGERNLISWSTRPWQQTDPTREFRIPLHPWSGGLAPDRLAGRTNRYAKGPMDTSHEGIAVHPPLINSVAMASGSEGFNKIEFDGVVFIHKGRYIYYFNPADGTATLDKDFGSTYTSYGLAVFDNQLIVGLGDTVKCWTRSIGINTSGTANAAVTSTNTTLTDTRLALTVDAYIGATVTCNGKTLVVTSNTATTFTGASWSGGGNPGNGNAWSVAGTWTEATNNTYGRSFVTIDEKLYRAVGNKISSCITAPLTLASWTPTSGNEYEVGSSTYPIIDMIEYNGALWAGTAEGVWQIDPLFAFHNQTPQLKIYPHSSNTRGMFVAHGSLWVPSVSGLYRIRLGASVQYGPELTQRPGYQFWVRGGFEFRGDIYLLVNDEAASSNTSIIKMVRVPENPNQYTYHEIAGLAATTKGYFITLTTKGTNPQVVCGLGNDLRWFKLGRGSVRHIDDANYPFGTSANLETGLIQPGPDASILAQLQGVEVLCNYSNAGDSLTVNYSVDEASFANLLTTQEGGGTAAITTTPGYQVITRYAPTTASGHFLNFQFVSTLTSATGTDRPEIREAWAFGKLRARVTDVLQVSLIADGSAFSTGPLPRDGITIDEAHRLFRSWADTATVLLLKIERYEENKNTRFMVEDVEVQDMVDDLGSGIRTNPAKVLNITLVRVPFGPDYAA